MKIFDKAKKIGSWGLAILIIILFLVPFAIAFYFYRKSGKRIQIYPEFKIIEIKGTENVDNKIIRDVIKTGEDILKRCNAIDRKENKKLKGESK